MQSVNKDNSVDIKKEMENYSSFLFLRNIETAVGIYFQRTMVK